MTHYKGFDIKENKSPLGEKYTIWYGLAPVARCKTVKQCKEYINLIIWARDNIPE